MTSGTILKHSDTAVIDETSRQGRLKADTAKNQREYHDLLYRSALSEPLRNPERLARNGCNAILSILKALKTVWDSYSHRINGV